MKIEKKISDFGQKIGGARKDLSRECIERIELVTDEALLLNPLSKVYRLPDLRAMFLSGAINEDQARMCMFAWNQIEAKPRNYRLKAWVTSTQRVLNLISEVMAGSRTTLEGAFDSYQADELLEIYLREMDAANWPAEAYVRGAFRVAYAPSSVSDKTYAVRDATHYKSFHTTMAEAVAAIRLLNAPAYGDSEKSPVLEIRRWTSSGEYFICPKGKYEIVLRRGIYDLEEARRIRKEEAHELQAEYDRLRTLPDVRPEGECIRIGEDYRHGSDLSPESFSALIPFRGVEFGNWLNQEDRVRNLNNCADALCDLAKITGLRPDALTHGGKLGMAFGSRGKSKAAAHYECQRQVINLTKCAGAGALAHEWFHSLDNALMIAEDQPLLFAVDCCMKMKNYSLQKAAINLSAAIKASDFAKRSRLIDVYRSKKYWGTMTELSARAFEAYVYYKMESAGMRNDYLVSFKKMDEYERIECYPYPTREEAACLAPLFDAFLTVAYGDAEKSQSPTEKEAVTLQVPYASLEKSPVFPAGLLQHRKYFACVETFCAEQSYNYDFSLVGSVKVRMLVSIPAGGSVGFDYDTVTRHRDVFVYSTDGSRRTRIKNWTVALGEIEQLSMAASYGLGEKSQDNQTERTVKEITKEQLLDLFEELQEDMDKNEGVEFKIKGMPGTYKYMPVMFHYCFAEGRITENQLLEAIRA